MPERNSNKRPESLYKYQSIYDHENLEEEKSLNNLFSSSVIFSRRTNFNDPFDSKVKIIQPTKLETKQIYKKLRGKIKTEFKKRYIGEKAKANLHLIDKAIHETINKYLFYCLTSKPDSNLMWSHYANSHKGFCIEWNASNIKAEQLEYKNNIATIKTIDYIKMEFNLEDDELFGKNIWTALKTKLKEWEYEDEYRFQLGNKMEEKIIEDFGDCALVKANPDWVKSIIFGCRMPERSREHIIEKMPRGMVFKVAKIGSSKIIIENYKKT